ncbi:hypothetical protein [Singulisphaera sp. GP187]|uniref:hypothetical protein n=1 Tax=Singulisphaera sp. GP187 TaxID=1882752 RepID=UPI0009406A0B|nr:hypothetical protein [Singulisphaera sp. GP187]
MILLVLGLAAGAGTTTSGATVTAGSPHVAVADGHRCQCKSCRGLTSCCCSPAKSKPTPPARPSSKPLATDSVQPSTGPCVSSAPCGGGEGLPTSATGLTMGKAVTLTEETVLRPSLGVPSPLSHADTLRSALLASRLDDPPEGCVPA